MILAKIIQAVLIPFTWVFLTLGLSYLTWFRALDPSSTINTSHLLSASQQVIPSLLPSFHEILSWATCSMATLWTKLSPTGNIFIWNPICYYKAGVKMPEHLECTMAKTHVGLVARILFHICSNFSVWFAFQTRYVCSPGWPETLNTSASESWVLELQKCCHNIKPFLVFYSRYCRYTWNSLCFHPKSYFSASHSYSLSHWRYLPTQALYFAAHQCIILC